MNKFAFYYNVGKERRLTKALYTKTDDNHEVELLEGNHKGKTVKLSEEEFEAAKTQFYKMVDAMKKIERNGAEVKLTKDGRIDKFIANTNYNGIKRKRKKKPKTFGKNKKK